MRIINTKKKCKSKKKVIKKILLKGQKENNLETF